MSCTTTYNNITPNLLDAYDLYRTSIRQGIISSVNNYKDKFWKELITKKYNDCNTCNPVVINCIQGCEKVTPLCLPIIEEYIEIRDCINKNICITVEEVQ